jgi:hypothetical protein
VGQDFATADKGKKFSKGGDMMSSKMKMFEKSGKDVEAKGMREGSKADMAMDKKQMMGMKKGGMACMAEGGMSDIAQDKAMIKKAFKQHDEQEHKGGKGTSLKLAKGGEAKYMSFDSKGQSAGMKSVTKMSSGGFTKSANGIAQRGLTKGTQIKMCGGGMYKGKK